jgi:hypothetical protein
MVKPIANMYGLQNQTGPVSHPFAQAVCGHHLEGCAADVLTPQLSLISKATVLALPQDLQPALPSKTG